MEEATETALMGRTTISVSDERADELHDMKGRGDSYDDVLARVLKENKELLEENERLHERLEELKE